jgi:hypothetical protein
VTGKIKTNPARLVRIRKENDAIVGYLNQYEPLPTNLRFLRPHGDEESRLRAVITKRFQGHMPELDIALNTGNASRRTVWAGMAERQSRKPGVDHPALKVG